MNKIKIYFYSGFMAIMAVCLSSCHKVGVTITTELTPDAFPLDSNQFVEAAGPVYVTLRGSYPSEYFLVQSLSTDESIMPARGGNWYDGGQNQQMHYHTWTKDNSYLQSNWTWMETIIGTSNQVLSVLNSNMPAGSFKNKTIAEIRMVRAFAYYMFMDDYGNVPIDTTYGDYTAKPNNTRKEVFNFLVSEVESCIPNLSSSVDVTTYGKPTLYMAYSLLAKLYLNAEIYTGEAKYDECIAACDKIISSGKYRLANRSEYLSMFDLTNGPSTPEFIFAIPYDAAMTNSYGFRGVNNYSRYTLPRSERAKYSLPFTPAGVVSTLPEFYALFNDGNDIRNNQWLTGLQYLHNGTPLTLSTTNIGYDQNYSGSNPNQAISYHVNLTPNIELRQSVATFDVGNDEIGWNMGYRNNKYYPDSTSANRNQNNDVSVFRYSDILLMKAEAILRGGASTLSQTPLSLVNSIRSNRTSSASWSSVSLNDLYEERSRELAYEGWHRNDMIRFGKFEGKWGFKTDADVNHRIFPIPTNALNLNRNLTQNPGY